MNREHEERWKELSAQASVEKDPAKMLKLMAEINRLLDEKLDRPSHDAARASHA